jgi:cytochrome c556
MLGKKWANNYTVLRLFNLNTTGIRAMRKITLLLLTTSSILLSLPASAQFAKAEDAIKYRKSSLFVMQQNFGRVAGMASGKVPFDAKVAMESATVAEFVSKLPWPAFTEGSDKGDTRSKPEIWKEPAKFKESAEKLQAEMSKLTAAVKTGNLDSIKSAVTATNGTCKACHDAFRKD